MSFCDGGDICGVCIECFYFNVMGVDVKHALSYFSSLALHSSMASCSFGMSSTYTLQSALILPWSKKTKCLGKCNSHV